MDMARYKDRRAHFKNAWEKGLTSPMRTHPKFGASPVP